MCGMNMLAELEHVTNEWRALEARRLRLMRIALGEGFAVVDVATAAGISPQRASQFRRQFGIEPRTPGRRPKEQPA